MVNRFDQLHVPQIVFDDRPELIELYRKAWELAADHIVTIPGMPVSRHMDEGFAPDRIWIWDTCFMVHFCKYAPQVFPGIQSLDNFYRPLYDRAPSSCLIHHVDNPPLFAWVEYEYYKFTGDRSRIHRNLVEKRYLQQHYEFIEHARSGDRLPCGFCLNTLQKNECGYLWSGIASGMDNTPRGEDIYTNLYWLDIMAQQALAARCIVKLALAIGEKDIAAEYQAKYQTKKDLLNERYFDSQDGIYYDLYAATRDACRVLTPASFWPLLAEVADKTTIGRQIDALRDPVRLGGPLPIPSVSRSSPHFCADGRYWRGGVWLPTSYMTIKAIEKYGYLDLAAELAEKTVAAMSRVYREFTPHTIWEAYAPTGDCPSTGKTTGSLCRPDFCGWSALGPISLLIENVIGIYEVDAVNNTVKLHRRRQGRHGVKQLRFGDTVCDIIITDNAIEVNTNRPFTLVFGEQKISCVPESELCPLTV